MRGKTLRLSVTLCALGTIFACPISTDGVPAVFGQESPDPFGDPRQSAADDPFGNGDPFGNSPDDPFGAPAAKESKDPFPLTAPRRSKKADLAKAAAVETANADEPAPTILQALDRKIDVSFVETPLGDVVEYLRAATRVGFQIDRRELESAGLGEDTPVTAALQGVSLRSLLRYMLRELDLTFVVRGGVIVITTPEAEEGHLETHVLPVRDLVAVRDEEGQVVADYDLLLELITSTVAPNTWDEVGGPASMQAFQGTLIISQTRDGHDEIRTLFAALRKLPAIDDREELSKQADAKQSIQVLPPIALGEEFEPVRKEIEKKLAHPIKFQCAPTPLGDVIALLGERHGVPILLDSRALENAGLGKDTPVEIQSGKVSLREGLRFMLQNADLTFVLRDEVILITTPEEVESHLEIVIYPVADLLSPGDESASASEQFEELIDAIVPTVQPNSWDEVGGPGSVAAYAQRGALICSQTQDVHAEIVTLLDKLRTARKEMEKLPAATVGDPETLVTQTYNLVPARGSLSPEKVAEVIKIVQRTITPLEWTDEAGAPLVHSLDSRLIVFHRPAVQRRIERLLGEIGVLRINTRPNGGSGPPGFF